MPKISAVIATYNRYQLLPKAIESALNQSLPSDQYRVIVVDNSPANPTGIEFQERYDQIENLTYLIEPTPGLSNARNVAARSCGTKYIAYLDDDAIACHEWLAEICAAFDAFGETAGIVGGKIDPIWGAPRPPWLHDDMLGMLTVVDWGRHRRELGPGEWIAGANVSFRVDALLRIGGFQTNLGRIGSGSVLLSNEESQVVEALKAGGFSLIWAPDAQVSHLVDTARLDPSWIRKRMAWQAVSDFIANEASARDRQAGYWNGVKNYFNSLPPSLRTTDGLFADVGDPALFKSQISGVYNLAMLLLTGSREPRSSYQSVKR